MFLYFRLLLSKGSRLYRHWRPHRRTGRYIVYCRGALVVYPTRVGCTAAFRFAAKKTRRANKKPTDVHGAGTRSPFLHKVRLSFGCWHSGIAMASDNAHRPAEGQLDLHSILQRQEPLPRPTPEGGPSRKCKRTTCGASNRRTWSKIIPLRAQPFAARCHNAQSITSASPFTLYLLQNMRIPLTPVIARNAKRV